MTTVAIRERGHVGGLRLLDPRRDLNQVADLIEEVFAGEIGPAGLAAVRDLRMMSQVSGLVWLMERASEEFRDGLTGFVWVEDGRVVGNVTLSRVKPDSPRWHISNVAVQSANRRRGIGRRLVEAAVELARSRGGEWAILQVRQDNASARRIYEQLGFVGLYSTVEMERAGRITPDRPPQAVDGYRLRAWRPHEWRRVYQLALDASSEMERWTRGVDMNEFRRPPLRRLGDAISDVVTGGRSWRVSLEYGQELAGALQVRWQGEEGTGSLNFIVRPAHRGRVEPWLVQHGLSLLDWRAERLLRSEISADDADGVAALAAAGFREKRTLLTMRLPL